MLFPNAKVLPWLEILDIKPSPSKYVIVINSGMWYMGEKLLSS